MRWLLYGAFLIAACTAGTQPSTTPGQTATTTDTTAAPESAEEVASAFVAAWVVGDDAAMASLAEPPAIEQAKDLAPFAREAWVFDHCEGAAGTVFCIWVTARDQLAIEVRNVETPRVVKSVSLVDV